MHCEVLVDILIQLLAYIHPFDDPALWTGHATMIEEIYADISQFRINNNKPDVIITVVGGGGNSKE